MKKYLLMGVAGCVVLACVVVFINRDRMQEKVSGGTECPDCMVSQASSLPAEDDPTSRRDGGGAGQGLQDAGDTEEGLQDAGGMDGLPVPQLSDSVKALLLQDGKKHNYPSLLAEISTLSYELSESDVAALMDMLAWSNDRFPEEMRPIEINAVKNDVLDKLLRQTELPEGIGLRMAAMAGDVNNDPVWRDYCVQFMGPFYERRASDIRGQTSEISGRGPQDASDTGQGPQDAGGTHELLVIRDAMYGALGERGNTIAGTALIGLENLSRTYEEFDRDLISDKATEIALDESASAQSRMTALRLASDLATRNGGTGSVPSSDDTEVVPPKEGVVDAARVLAQTGETVLLRSAAIVTLGEVGAETDRELLTSYLSDNNRQIAGAAQMALDKMDSRSQLMSDG